MPINPERHRKLVDWVLKNDPKAKQIRDSMLAFGFSIGLTVGLLISGLVWLAVHYIS